MLKKIQYEKNDWLPTYFAEGVVDIDYAYLKAQGIEAMMFDLDHTILRHGSYDVDEDNVAALRNSGMRVFIATNRRKSSGLDDIKSMISAEGIMFAQSTTIAKPSKEYYRLAAEMTGLGAEQVAMVGDRLVQDIWGANRSGLTTVMVGKFGNIKWFDQLPTVLDRTMIKVFRGSYKEHK